MTVRDHKSFLSPADEALFFNRQSVLRGKTEIMAGWK
jgi:hypothetical protein